MPQGQNEGTKPLLAVSPEVRADRKSHDNIVVIMTVMLGYTVQQAICSDGI